MAGSSTVSSGPRAAELSPKLAQPHRIVNLQRVENTLPILVADGPGALTELCGVNLLERLLRILQRLGFRSAIREQLRAKLDTNRAEKGCTAAHQHPTHRPGDHAAIPVSTSGRL